MTGGNTSVFLERYAAATVYSCDVCDDDFCRQIYDCVERASAYMCLCCAVKILDSQSVSQSVGQSWLCVYLCVDSDVSLPRI